LNSKEEGLKGGGIRSKRYLEEEEGVKRRDFRKRKRRRKGRLEGS